MTSLPRLIVLHALAPAQPVPAAVRLCNRWARGVRFQDQVLVTSQRCVYSCTAVDQFQVCVRLRLSSTRLADYGVAGFSKGLFALLTEFPGRPVVFCTPP